MADKVYEGMFILDSNRYARDPNGVTGQIQQLVEKCNGEMLASRLWNEQKKLSVVGWGMLRAWPICATDYRGRLAASAPGAC